MTSASPAATSNVVKIDPAHPESQHLFNLSKTLEESSTLSPKPVFVSLELEPSAFRPEFGGFTDPTQSPFSQPKGVFDCAVRVPGPSSTGTNRIWFFPRGDSFFSYVENAAGDDEVGAPVLLADNTGSSFTGNWPARFASGIDAFVLGTGSYEGEAWVFNGRDYFRLSLADRVVVQEPKSIADGWIGVGDAFAGGIDAGVHGVDDYLGSVWLFKGSEYLRYDLEGDKTVIEPRPIAGNWVGMPAEFAAGIDFAFYGTGSHAQHIFFFRGDKYVRYNLKAERVEEGPESIIRNWPMLARFMPSPQLFLVEEYVMHTFRGEIGPGPFVQGPQPKIAPHGHTEFYILTKHSETITARQQTNILETHSEQAVNRFSEAVKKDASQAGSKSSSEYQLDASFEGEASMTLGGGEASADLTAKTKSQDVRKSFGNAVGKQTSKMADETAETHREQASVAGKEHTVNEEVETGFFQTIDNSDNPEPMNIELFQLKQQYILVTCLTDAKLVFHNDDPREALSVPLRDAASLLEKRILDPADRKRVLATIADVFSNVIDHEGKTRALTVPLPDDPERFATDPTLHSSFEVKNSDGKHLRTIDVPGIVVHTCKPMVLTSNVEMTVIGGAG